jgi:hypothetical protein
MGRTGGDRDCDQPPVGTRRGPARVAGRGGRDHATISMRRRASGLPPARDWRPEAAASVLPTQTQNAPRHSNEPTPREVLVVLRPERQREIAPHRSAPPSRDRQGPRPFLAHARLARGLFRRHGADDSIDNAITKLIRSHLILIDDVGLLPVSADGAYESARSQSAPPNPPQGSTN